MAESQNYQKDKSRRKPKKKFKGKADKALALAKKAIKAVPKSERKRLAVETTSTAIASTPIIYQLTNCSQGSSEGTREGNQIYLQTIDFKMIVAMDSAATESSFRCMIVEDNATNGAIYTAGQLLKDSSVSDSIVSLINYNYKNRFRILRNDVLQFSINGNRNAYVQYHIPINKTIQYSGNVGDITDLVNKSYSILLVSDEAVNSPTVTFAARMKYIDS